MPRSSSNITDPKQLERVVADLLACHLGTSGTYRAHVLPFGSTDGGYDGVFTGPLEGLEHAEWRISVKLVTASRVVDALKRNLRDEMERHRGRPVLVVTNRHLTHAQHAQLGDWLLTTYGARAVVYDGSKLDHLLRTYPWVLPDGGAWLSAADGLLDLGWSEAMCSGDLRTQRAKPQRRSRTLAAECLRLLLMFGSRTRGAWDSC